MGKRVATQGQAAGWWWGKGAGQDLIETRNLAPQLLREQEPGGTGLGGGVYGKRKNATDTAGSACIIEAEGPPSSPSGFREDRARGREGRSGELRPFPKSQTQETEGTEVSPCHTYTRGNLGLGEMRTPFVSGGT